MPYDLRFESWLPWRRKSGVIEWGTPASITDGVGGEDPIVALACPRPDFTGAVTEFLIGLYSVALAPRDEADWRKLWDAPPAPADIDVALRTLPDAFFLDGDGTRAFQTLTPMDFDANKDRKTLDKLLIGSPGESTKKLGKDFFMKRDQFSRIGRPAAAMALITLQTYAPGDGAGILGGLRGPGPLTTLVDPRSDPSSSPIWLLVAANLETTEQADDRDPDRSRKRLQNEIFPWLSSDRVEICTPVDASAYQAYFAVPRRLRLEVVADPCVCDLTGLPDTNSVIGIAERPYGVSYRSWIQPLSPYSEMKDGSGPKAWQGKHRSSVGWKDWLGLVAKKPESGCPARAVAQFVERRWKYCCKHARVDPRVICWGFRFDQATTELWIQSELPAFPSETIQRQASFAERCLGGADVAAGRLVRAVKQGLFDNPKDAPGDFSGVRGALWDATEADFFACMTQVAEELEAFDAAKAAENFSRTIRNAALTIFDQHCPLDGFEHGKMRRPIAARYNLARALSGYGKAGADFYRVLVLTPPESSKSRKSKEPA